MTDQSEWKTPDEIMRLQLLKKKTNALQARIVCPVKPKTNNHSLVNKRKNPFVDKRESTNLKKPKLMENDNQPEEIQLINENSIFKLLAENTTSSTKNLLNKNNQLEVFSDENNKNIIPQHPSTLASSLILSETNAGATSSLIETTDSDEQQKSSKHIPFDWSLKSKIRILTLTPISGTVLKSNQEASGITSFVRCLNPTTSSTNLDLSPGARFHQATMFWQHPHLPWLTLFPRNSMKNDGNGIGGESERKALFKDWTESFRSLFQLLRSRQCPFFYVCTNSFVALFLAAGVGGRTEIHTFVTPTSRGLRTTLKQEEIEFSLPLRENKSNENENKEKMDINTEAESYNLNGSNDYDENIDKNTNDHDNHQQQQAAATTDDDDQENWLTSLGVEQSEIQKISSVHARSIRNIECLEDFSDNSIILIEGIECQAFFNFLLHSKSSINVTGRLAGIPPTLFSPVGFPGATLRNLQTKSTKIHVENNEYLSTEIKGIILPHILPYLCNLLSETKETFSASMMNYPKTVSFSKASKLLIEREINNDKSNNVFGQANLSDCGLPSTIIESLCRCTKDSVSNLERMCFKKSSGYTWN